MESPSQVADYPDADDPRRLRAALGYLFTPVVPLLNMTGSSTPDHWMRYHSVQALLWSGPFVLLLVAVVLLLVVVVSANFLFICLLPVAIVIPFLPGMFWARRIYLGGEVKIPILGDFVRRY